MTQDFEWIKAEDSLPKYGKNVLVIDSSEPDYYWLTSRISPSKHNRSRCDKYDFANVFGANITHWAYVPKIKEL